MCVRLWNSACARAGARSPRVRYLPLARGTGEWNVSWPRTCVSSGSTATFVIHPGDASVQLFVGIVYVCLLKSGVFRIDLFPSGCVVFKTRVVYREIVPTAMSGRCSVSKRGGVFVSKL